MLNQKARRGPGLGFPLIQVYQRCQSFRVDGGQSRLDFLLPCRYMERCVLLDQISHFIGLVFDDIVNSALDQPGLERLMGRVWRIVLCVGGVFRIGNR
jgi:hypothetical protein